MHVHNQKAVKCQNSGEIKTYYRNKMQRTELLIFIKAYQRAQERATTDPISDK